MDQPHLINQRAAPLTDGLIMTVSGAIDPASMGFTLSHEHVMSTFGAERARYPFYDRERVLASVLPYLQRVRTLGCQTLVDCTTAYFGRHPELLRDIAAASGLQILTNTGCYGAADGIYVPPHAYEETADQLAARWTREWIDSIDGTGVRPGFIKTALDAGPLSAIDRKLFIAAARTHRETGLTIQSHTGDNWGAVQEMLSILRAENVHPSAWIWVHAHSVREPSKLVEAAEKGTWISLDGISADTSTHILEMLREIKGRGHIAQVLLSHDGDSFFGDGEFRPYHYLFTDFLPKLEESGFTDADIHAMTVSNPARAYAIRTRLVE
jgi:predicted metal-dependent phosphotriesterase family hydrolase